LKDSTLPRIEWTLKLKEQLRELRMQGLGVFSISLEMGFSQNVILRQLQEMGLEKAADDLPIVTPDNRRWMQTHRPHGFQDLCIDGKPGYVNYKAWTSKYGSVREVRAKAGRTIEERT
jgi:hypothetical protein